MLLGGKSGAQVMQLVSAWLRSELSPSDSGASHPHSAQSSQRAESLALTRRSLPSSPLPSMKQFAWAAPLQSAAFCAKGPQGSHMSSRCLWPISGMSSAPVWLADRNGGEKQVWPTAAGETKR